ncbi:hypothetical protein M0805_000318 [Coniferiporia weirii]|nr:hypothetical protein M0805_000318 [Coniferiporia weirii]
MKSFTVLATLSVAFSVLARPTPQSSSFLKQNGEDAINLNKQFADLTADSSCDAGENACVNQEFAQCVDGKFVLESCGSGLICAALPLVNSAGTSITCTTQSDIESRIAATGATDNGSGGSDTSSASSTGQASTTTKGAASTRASTTRTSTNAASSSTSSASGSTGDLQTSLCLDSSLVQTGFEKNGQQTPAQNQVASATSSNNFINFCATVGNLPLTNGQQVKGGSCNAAPMGVIASTSNMPSAKFQFPQNMDVIKANSTFTVKMAIKNLATGNFVNADANYFSAPQTVDNSGDIVGHSHIVIEQISSISDTNPTDPTQFAFFKGLNDKADNGVLSVDVSGGLPTGTYRIASINSAANHQPVLVAVAQHGSLDDMVYVCFISNIISSTKYTLAQCHFLHSSPYPKI